jgi:predicted negative regulator of RcsB-dependent stress response
MVKKSTIKKKEENLTGLEKLRDFLLHNWKYFLGGLIIIFVVLGSYYGYSEYKKNKINNASEKYFEFEQVLQEGFEKQNVDYERLEKIEKELKMDYKGTIYPGMATYQLGNYNFLTGEYDKGINKFNECLEYTDDSDLILSSKWGIGDCYYEKGEYKKAVESYLEIYENYPQNELMPHILIKLCYTYVELDEPDKVYEYATHIITNFPTSSIVQEAKMLRDFVDTY